MQVGEPERAGRPPSKNYSRERNLAEDTARPINMIFELLGGKEKKTFEERVREKVGERRQDEIINMYVGLFGRENLNVILRHVGIGRGKYRLRELPDLEFMLRDLAKKGKFGKKGQEYAEGVLDRIKKAEGSASAGEIHNLHEFTESNPLGEKGAEAAAGGQR